MRIYLFICFPYRIVVSVECRQMQWRAILVVGDMDVRRIRAVMQQARNRAGLAPVRRHAQGRGAFGPTSAAVRFVAQAPGVEVSARFNQQAQNANMARSCGGSERRAPVCIQHIGVCDER